MSEIAQGLQLSVYGILITFASLGLLIIVMIILRELFNPKQKESPDQNLTTETNASQESDDEMDYIRQQAVGIAVSVAFMKSQKKRGANLGQLLESPPGQWWSASRRSPNE